MGVREWGVREWGFCDGAGWFAWSHHMTTPCADMVAGHRRQWAPMAVVAS